MRNMLIKHAYIILLVIVMTLIFVTIYFLWSSHVSSAFNSKIDGSFYNSYSPWGDSFAPLNLFVSFFSAIGLIVTIYLQIKFNREQWILSYNQNFSNEFYQFLSRIDDMKNNFSIKDDVDVFGSIYCIIRDGIIESDVDKQIKDINNSEDNNEKERIILWMFRVLYMAKNVKIYGFFFYIRSISSFMKKIKYDRLLNEKQKKEYFVTLCGNMGYFPIMLMAIYGLSPKEKHIKDAIIEYDLLNNLTHLPYMNDAICRLIRGTYGDNIFDDWAWFS